MLKANFPHQLFYRYKYTATMRNPPAQAQVPQQAPVPQVRQKTKHPPPPKKKGKKKKERKGKPRKKTKIYKSKFMTQNCLVFCHFYDKDRSVCFSRRWKPCLTLAFDLGPGGTYLSYW